MKRTKWTNEQASSVRTGRVRRNQGAGEYQLDSDCNEAARRTRTCAGSQPQRTDRTICTRSNQSGGSNTGGILRQLINKSERQLAKISGQIAQLEQERQRLDQEQQEALQEQQQLRELLEQLQQRD